jgi:hypothetical protein
MELEKTPLKRKTLLVTILDRAVGCSERLCGIS